METTSCLECKRSTSGKCREHMNIISVVSSPQNSTLNTASMCIACGKQSEFTTKLPWGSQYDGDYLCGDCICAFVDPVINWIKSMKEKK